MEINEKITRYQKYREKSQALSYALRLIHWDALTGAPKSGAPERNQAIGFLSNESFLHSISPEYEEIINDLFLDYDKLDPIYQRIVTLSKKSIEESKKIPPELMKQFNILVAESNDIWEKAKSEDNYDLFAPYLEKLIKMSKEVVGYVGVKNGSVYNTLLDDYEEGLTTEELDKFFNTLKSEIVPLLKKVLAKKKELNINNNFTKLEYPIDKQEQLSEFLMKLLTFDGSRGMLKTSAHPFSMELSKNDIRMTTNYQINDLLSNIYSVIHETGHSIYSQNESDEIAKTILKGGASMAIHESQSRFFENVIGRDKRITDLIYLESKRLFPEQFKNVTAEDFFMAVNNVETGLVRIESDELSYTLHILIRYEIEKMIINGDVEVQKLPEIWNCLVKEYLGLDVPSNKLGILQDVHWSGASFGYFPSYALGNAYAAQLLHKMKQDIDYDGLLEKGDIGAIKAYLTEKIHQYGRLFKPSDLICNATGEKLNPKYFTDYLKEKYSKIYKLD